MSDKSRSHVEDLRGASRLAIEATKAVTGLVQEMHRTIVSGPAVLGQPLAEPARLITGLVYGTIRGVTDVVGVGIDAALSQLAPLLGESAPGNEREAVLAALNGVLGDYLEATHNPLAIPMQLRKNGAPLVLERDALSAVMPAVSGNVVLLLHGSSMDDLSWRRKGHDHGASLEAELGSTAVYLRYNSGRHVSINGRALAALIDQLDRVWPVPLTELTLLCHSMGGLVARSACHYGELEGFAWRGKVDKLITLGTPHHGAPLERSGNWVDVMLGISRYSAPLSRLGKIRSEGVTDLRYGNVLDQHWMGRDRFALELHDSREPLPLPSGVACYAIAATLSKAPADRLLGDGLVPVESALGKHVEAPLNLAFPEARQWIAYGLDHLGLLESDPVYQVLKRWLSP